MHPCCTYIKHGMTCSNQLITSSNLSIFSFQFQSMLNERWNGWGNSWLKRKEMLRIKETITATVIAGGLHGRWSWTRLAATGRWWTWTSSLERASRTAIPAGARNTPATPATINWYLTDILNIPALRRFWKDNLDSSLYCKWSRWWTIQGKTRPHRMEVGSNKPCCSSGFPLHSWHCRIHLSTRSNHRQQLRQKYFQF